MSSALSQFLTDPWSTLKVLAPSVAVEVILHKQVWQKASLRDLTLCLALVNAYWLGTTLNVSFFETPLLCQVPGLDERQQAEIARHRYGWINKAELVIGVVSLDLYCEWRKRIMDHNGFVDLCLSKAVIAPVLISAVQSAYLLPKASECCRDRQIAGVRDNSKQKCNIHRAYVGFEAAKLVGVAVAGLRFGKMLTV
ncbi:hypothetical protein LRAMOSA07171 [Lichtheimia ramosa]|uniref:Uncharacterized protein n=1 Tax=Lichtheimia ramosa TaxID=688394 RepID=A0A077WB52_9FUNG|nr:hypothetical protein LRAMOSA07171 [Lichtheimia ramosa]